MGTGSTATTESHTPGRRREVLGQPPYELCYWGPGRERRGTETDTRWNHKVKGLSIFIHSFSLWTPAAESDSKWVILRKYLTGDTGVHKHCPRSGSLPRECSLCHPWCFYSQRKWTQRVPVRKVDTWVKSTWTVLNQSWSAGHLSPLLLHSWTQSCPSHSISRTGYMYVWVQNRREHKRPFQEQVDQYLLLQGPSREHIFSSKPMTLTNPGWEKGIGVNFSGSSSWWLTWLAQETLCWVLGT